MRPDVSTMFSLLLVLAATGFRARDQNHLRTPAMGPPSRLAVPPKNAV